MQRSSRHGSESHQQDGNSDKSHDIQKEEFVKGVAERKVENAKEIKARTTVRESEANFIASHSKSVTGGNDAAREEREARAAKSSKAASELGGPAVRKLSDEELANQRQETEERDRRVMRGEANEDD